MYEIVGKRGPVNKEKNSSSNHTKLERNKIKLMNLRKEL
jgi:hypothetical protein